MAILRWFTSHLHWIPFVVGLVSSCFYVYFIAARSAEIHDTGLWIMMLVGAVIGLIAVMQSVVAAATTTRLNQQRQALQALLTQTQNQNEQLIARTQVFTAMREVVQVLGDDVDFKQIAVRVLDVLAPLLGSENIAIILPNEKGVLSVRALRQNGRTTYPDTKAAEQIELLTATQAMENETVVRTVHGMNRVFCVPIFADHAAMGVMRFEIPAASVPGEDDRRVYELEATLADIARHMSLVVKTPRLYDHAIIDSVTRLFVRRHFDTNLSEKFELARRYKTPFSLVILDIDYFKKINDTYGHQAGDAVLREVANVITGTIRECDIAFRLGGDEFAVLLPETTPNHAAAVAARLRKTLNIYPLKFDHGTISVTASMGISGFDARMKEPGELVALADEAMYKAKRAGRNLVMLAGGPAKQELPV